MKIATIQGEEMMRFIVEAPKPKNGQTASSGGIRSKSGPMVTLYKNPVPYKEPFDRTVVKSQKINAGQRKNSLLSQTSKYVISRILLCIWEEGIEPLIREKIRCIPELLKDINSTPKAIEMLEAHKKSIFTNECNNIISLDEYKARSLHKNISSTV